MPIPPIIQRDLFAAALRTLSTQTGIPNTLAYTQDWLRRANPDPQAWGYQSIQGVQRAAWQLVRTAKESVDMGHYITQTGQEVGAVPRVPADSSWTADYRYRVAVGITDETGLRRTTVVDVYSPHPIALTTISDEAIGVASQEQTGPGRSPIPGFADAVSAGGVTDVYVLSAGRR